MRVSALLLALLLALFLTGCGAAEPETPRQHGMLQAPGEALRIEPEPPEDSVRFSLLAEILPSGRYFRVRWEGPELWAATLRGVERFRLEVAPSGSHRLIRLSHRPLPGHTRDLWLLPGGELLTGDDYAGLGRYAWEETGPVELGRLPTESICRAILVRGDRVFFGVHSRGLRTARLEPEGGLRSEGRVPTQGRVFHLADGPDGLLVVSDGPGGLATYRVPAAGLPEEQGRCPDVAWAMQADVRDGRALVADRRFGLRLVDLTDPALPRLLGSCPLTGEVRSVARRGRWVYGATSHELAVVDWADPGAPRLVRRIQPVSEFRDLALRPDGLLAAADGDAGVRIFDLARPEEPREIASALQPRLITDLAVAGGLLAVTAGRDGLYLVDHTGGGLEPLGHLPGPGNSVGVAARGSLAYVTDWRGLRTISLEDPTRPVLLAELPTPGRAVSIALDGELGLLADWFGGVHVLDLSEPRRPRIRANLPTQGFVVDVWLEGTVGYAASIGDGLIPIDLTDPDRPRAGVILSRVAGPEGMVRRGDLLYVADFNSGLAVVDVSAPLEPRLVGTLETGPGKGVSLRGDQLLLANYYHGLELYDLSDPRRPRRAGLYDTPGKSYESALLPDGTLAVADWHSLLRLQLDDLPAPS